MKPLYYLEITKSIDENNQPIPAKSLKWKIRIPKLAWESREMCNNERMDVQELCKYHIIRVSRANLFKNIIIRISNWIGDGWYIV